jgi:hypothetical protein
MLPLLGKSVGVEDYLLQRFLLQRHPRPHARSWSTVQAVVVLLS